MKKRFRKITSVCLVVVMVAIMIPVVNISVNAESVIESAIAWAIDIANDDSHLYSQSVRWGPSYDCSSFVISAYNAAGIDTGSASWTGDMIDQFTKHGFIWIDWSQIGNVSNLQRGDVLLYHDSNNTSTAHTEIYLGNNMNVGAHSAKRPAADQISVSGYYWHPWHGVLRYAGINPNLPDPEVENWFYHGATDYSDFRPVISFINPETVSSVKFAVRYDTGDWKWYDGEFNGSNAWFCDVLSSDLGIGNYIICHAYVYGKNGSYKGYPYTELTLGKDANPSVQTWYYDGATEHSDFRPVIRFDNPETVSSVKFAVRYDTGDWKWYDGMYNGGNAWYCDVLSDDLGSGNYILCHGYVYANNGSYKGYPFVNLKLDKDYEDPSLNNWYYTIDIPKKEINYIIDFNNPETVSNVRFAIRTENTDWEWYDGTYNGDNEWNFTVQIDGYEEGEIIYCHCYVKGRNGFYDGYPYPEVEVKIKQKIGDVDGDSNVDIKDTTLLQKYLAGLVTLCDEQLALADTNGDGSVTILDATQIQKYLAGLVTALG